MTVYKKKAETIEAIKWTGWIDGNILEVMDFVGENNFEVKDNNIYIISNGIRSLIKEGQYIIKGSLGYMYGMDSMVFEKFYEQI